MLARSLVYADDAFHDQKDTCIVDDILESVPDPVKLAILRADREFILRQPVASCDGYVLRRLHRHRWYIIAEHFAAVLVSKRIEWEGNAGQLSWSPQSLLALASESKVEHVRVILLAAAASMEGSGISEEYRNAIFKEVCTHLRSTSGFSPRDLHFLATCTCACKAGLASLFSFDHNELLPEVRL